MLKKYFSILTLLFAMQFSQAQIIVINEIDSDTPSIDDKEFIELKSSVPNFALDGYVVVFYNGSPTSNRSYFTINLNGLVTDANGLILIGNTLVSPVPSRIFSNNVIQNGPDAVAIYQGSPQNFPMNTLATQTNLIHAMAYGNSATEATVLMNLLGLTVQYNENASNQGTIHSLQRKADGTYEAKLPTPGAENDGTGIIFNGITISVPASQYNEGDSFPITFTTQMPVTTDLTFTFDLTNETFDTNDFVGNTTAFIPAGTTTFSTTIQIVDDSLDEGDELIKIKFGSLPDGFIRMNDQVEIRIIDNDFVLLPWGTPLNPTFGNVSSTAPAGYYDSLEGKSGAVLKQAVQDIIANPAVVRAHNYGDIIDILKIADQNPLNSNEVWLMYKEVSRSKFLFQDSGSGTGRWNREHIYPQSRGGFSNATSNTADGIGIWEPSNANMIAHGHADAHHLRAEDGPENSSRNNRDFGLNDYNGYAGNFGSWKGDVARAVFYMAVRYNGLDVVNGNPPDSTVGQLGDLGTLLQWNHADASDDFEMNRNNYVYTWQVNRNPFIDYPDLADFIWGNRVGEPWFASLSIPNNLKLNVSLYPNPAKNYISVLGLNGEGSIEIYSVTGQMLMKSNVRSTEIIPIQLTSGMYLAKISSEGKTAVKKILVQ